MQRIKLFFLQLLSLLIFISSAELYAQGEAVKSLEIKGVIKDSAGEKVSIRFDRDKVSIDRSESGLMTDHRHFADVVVAAPLSLCDGKDGYDVDIYVDVASIELFVDGGRIAMTDIVFPNLPYSQFSIGCLNGEALMGNLKLYELK